MDSAGTLPITAMQDVNLPSEFAHLSRHHQLKMILPVDPRMQENYAPGASAAARTDSVAIRLIIAMLVVNLRTVTAPLTRLPLRVALAVPILATLSARTTSAAARQDIAEQLQTIVPILEVAC